MLLYIRIKPCDFDYLKIIGKGSFGKVSLSNFSFYITNFHLLISVTAATQSLTQIFDHYRFCWLGTRNPPNITPSKCYRRKSS